MSSVNVPEMIDVMPRVLSAQGIAGAIYQAARHLDSQRDFVPGLYNFRVEVRNEAECKGLMYAVEASIAEIILGHGNVDDIELQEVVAHNPMHGSWGIVVRLYT